MPELNPKDRFDLQCRLLVVLFSIGLIFALVVIALVLGYDGVALTSGIGVIGAIAGSFLGTKITDILKELRRR